MPRFRCTPELPAHLCKTRRSRTRSPKQPDRREAKEQELPFDRFPIVRCKQKRPSHGRGRFESNINGKAKQEQKSIAAKIEPMPQGWLKITPANPLTPGEYGLVELMNGKGELNLNMQSRYLPDNIWDFGMDPAAPANAMAIMPEDKPAGQASRTAKAGRWPVQLMFTQRVFMRRRMPQHA